MLNSGFKQFWGSWLFYFGSPECRLKPQFVNGLNKDTNIMAENLTKNLVNLSDRGFSPYRTPEFCFYHREGGFHIRPLVIMGQELFPIEVVKVPHSLPQSVKCTIPLSTLAIGFKWDIRRSVYCLHFGVNSQIYFYLFADTGDA